jgi:hypothetical protein
LQAIAEAQATSLGHMLAIGVTQAPPPLHDDAGVSWPAEHDAPPQLVPAATYWQSPTPSHLPFKPQAPPARHAPFDEPPGATGLQSPSGNPVWAALQAKHFAVHALSQQNPPTHVPAAQAPALVQAAPSPTLAWQTPVLQ